MKNVVVGARKAERREYYVAHREERKAHSAAYYAAHREERRAHNTAYHAARGLVSALTANDLAQIAARFWPRVAQGASEACWPYLGFRNRNGYGEIGFKAFTLRAHRVSFFLARGYWPKVTRHTCDNPPCVNPAHLIDGSQSDNSHDMHARGRAAKGSRNGVAKLTEEDAANILSLAGLCRAADLAAAFGVSRRTISHIKQRRSWRHV